MPAEGHCFYCSYKEHLSADIQCPVIGIGEPLDNASLLEKHGTLEAALKFYRLDDESLARSAAASEALYRATR